MGFAHRMAEMHIEMCLVFGEVGVVDQSDPLPIEIKFQCVPFHYPCVVRTDI